MSWAVDSSPRTRSTARHSRSGAGELASTNLRDGGTMVIWRLSTLVRVRILIHSTRKETI